MEKKIRTEAVVVLRQRWRCPKDGCDGEMICDGVAYTSNPPQFGHVCNVCQHGDMASSQFPAIVHEPFDIQKQLERIECRIDTIVSALDSRDRAQATINWRHESFAR